MMRHVKTNLKNSQNIGSEDKAGNFCFVSIQPLFCLYDY